MNIEAEDTIIPHILSTMNGNKLTLSYDTSTPTPIKPVTFYLTVKDLSSLSLSGAVNVVTDGFKTESLVISTHGDGEGNMAGLSINNLTVNLAGTGKMHMYGTATDQTITINGVGDYQARDLKSQNTTITINGAGKGTLNVGNILNVIINGSGELSYLGNPQMNQQINGAGTVKQITM